MIDSQKKRLKTLVTVLASIKSDSDMDAFLDDLCTPAELTSMADRWYAAQLIDEGIPYRTIYESTGISTATVTRVARSLTHGSAGYQKALQLKKGAKK